MNTFLCHDEPYVATIVVYNCYTDYLGKTIMKLQRLLAILSLLCERDKAAAQELAGRFEVSKRRVSSKNTKNIQY